MRSVTGSADSSFGGTPSPRLHGPRSIFHLNKLLRSTAEASLRPGGFLKSHPIRAGPQNVPLAKKSSFHHATGRQKGLFSPLYFDFPLSYSHRPLRVNGDAQN